MANGTDAGVAVAPVPEARADAPGLDWAKLGPSLESVLIPFAALLASLLLFGGFVAAAGRDPLDVYYEMYRGAFGTAA